MRVVCGVGMMLMGWLFWVSREEEVPQQKSHRDGRISGVFGRAGSWCFCRWERWKRQRGRADAGKKARLCGELYLGRSAKESLREHEIRRWSILLLILGCSFLLGFLLSFQEQDGVVRTMLERNAAGEGSRKYELWVRGLEEEAALEISVGDRVIEDTETLFQTAREEVLAQLFTGGDTAECVRGDLRFAAKVCDGLVSVVWEPMEPQYIRYDGSVKTEDLPEEGAVTEVQVTFAYEDTEVTERIALHVMPPQYTEEKRQQEALLTYMQELEAEKRYEEVYVLPEMFEGKPLTFLEPTEQVMPEQVLGFGTLVAICAFVLEDRRLLEQGRKREEQMQMDYPEVVLKLTVLIRAGLTVRGAWERIVNGYVTLRNEGQKQVRYVYEEMLQTSLRMQGGLPEAEAYLEFGRRTHLHAYLKLSSLLEQNLKKGSRGLVHLLETESEAAWAQRKNVAKQKGEEAGTRLLLPLFLLLLLVMLLIMIPAVLSF